MKRILFLLSLLQVTLIASAYDINVDGIRYNFTSDSTVAVTYINRSANDEYRDDMVIPTTINYEGKKYAVTAIDFRKRHLAQKRLYSQGGNEAFPSWE